MNNRSIGALTRETYQRLIPSPEGIRVDRLDDLESAVDRGIPPVFKRLPFGLRGTPTDSVRVEGPLPFLHFEARNAPSVAENLRILPPNFAGTERADLSALMRHHTPGDRGLLSSVSALQQRAESLDIDPS